MAGDGKLTTKQLKAIPKILAARTCEQGCKAAGVSKTCFYDWMQDETFRAELERRRDELVTEGFAALSQNVGKAVETLIGLLDTNDPRLQRLTAKDILEHHLKYKELTDLEQRIEAIEEKIGQR
jgi:hypothetical protein